jgi:hypothetical protein
VDHLHSIYDDDEHLLYHDEYQYLDLHRISKQRPGGVGEKKGVNLRDHPPLNMICPTTHSRMRAFWGLKLSIDINTILSSSEYVQYVRPLRLRVVEGRDVVRYK